MTKNFCFQGHIDLVKVKGSSMLLGWYTCVLEYVLHLALGSRDLPPAEKKKTNKTTIIFTRNGQKLTF